jgi:hypothetical protein
MREEDGARPGCNPLCYPQWVCVKEAMDASGKKLFDAWQMILHNDRGDMRRNLTEGLFRKTRRAFWRELAWIEISE